ncbi:MAG: hypothetical protein NC181_03665 [Clostridium sp.]|nr:hypothetical protein [Clostridium sp.]MCM1444590.1 hypothetical protein [Candidatus Amulumruptor caecigallinarius]
MKYLKGTLVAFVATFIFSLVYVSAGNTLTFIDITIPGFQGTYTSEQRDKTDNINMQYIEKYDAIDDLSGDNRAVNARVRGMLAGMQNSSWVATVADTKVALGDNSKTLGSWKMELKANKWLVSSASFWGMWTYQ